MPLVNALQNNSPDVFNQNLSEAPSRFSKIKSLWSFQVQGQHENDAGDSEPSRLDAGESETPSSFIT